MLDLKPYMELAAPIFEEKSRRLCSHDYVDMSSCQWYHGAWIYLRALDLVSSPTWHEDFYRTSLSDALATGRRALITGTADFSLLALVLDAQKDHDGLTTVLDLCATPLAACRWYAERVSRRVELEQSDVLTHADNGGRDADVILSDAFLTRFPPHAVPQVLASWSKLAAPEASLVTTVRLHPTSYSDRDEELGKRAFIDRGMDAYRASSMREIIDEESFRHLVVNYTKNMKSSRLGSKQEMLNIFSDSDWRIKSAEVALVKGEYRPTEYLRIHAKKER